MRKIKKEKTKYHKYVFEFDYDQTLVNKCKQLKEEVGWKKFNFNGDNWVFSDMKVLAKLMQFTTASISDEVKADYKRWKNRALRTEERKKNAKQIKNKDQSDIEVPGLKLDLYDFQKKGVEFLDNSGGRALLADEMGCIGGEAEIRVMRSGNYKRYNLETMWRRWNGHAKNITYNWNTEDIPTFTLSFDYDKEEMVWNRVKNIIKHEEKRVFKVHAHIAGWRGNREIIMTPDHKVCTPDGDWVEIQDLEPDDMFWARDYNDKPPMFCEPKLCELVKKRPAGRQDVYDIKMEGPPHNFVAESLIVHNSGKTIQSIAYHMFEEFDRTLVISPASVKRSWSNEIDKWTDLDSTLINSQDYHGTIVICPETAKGHPKEKDEDQNYVVKWPERYEMNGQTRLNLKNSDFYIVNYSIVKKFLPLLEAADFDLVIADESHKLKNKKAQRTKATTKLAEKVDNIVLMSGTPMMNRTEELYTSLNMISPEEWSSWWDFTQRYCDGEKTRFGYQYDGSSNLRELYERIQHYFIRRRKEDVLDELPEKIFTDVPVEMGDGEWDKYWTLARSLEDYLHQYTDKTQDEIETMKDGEHLVQLNEMKKLTTQAKISATKDKIDSITAGGDKVLLFSCFNDPLEQINEDYGDESVMLIGSMGEEERADAVEEFQEDEGVKLFCGGMNSANVGITLTEASYVVFLDYDWTPANMMQAVDRCHRPGTDADVINVYQMYVPNTIDEYMQEILGDKQELFNRLIEGETFDKKGMYNSLLDKIEQDINE